MPDDKRAGVGGVLRIRRDGGQQRAGHEAQYLLAHARIIGDGAAFASILRVAQTSLGGLARTVTETLARAKPDTWATMQATRGKRCSENPQCSCQLSER